MALNLKPYTDGLGGLEDQIQICSMFGSINVFVEIWMESS